MGVISSLLISAGFVSAAEKIDPLQPNQNSGQIQNVSTEFITACGCAACLGTGCHSGEDVQ